MSQQGSNLGLPPRDPQPSRLQKAVHAYNQGGARYLWHKSMRRSLEHWPSLKRRIVYADPRGYWTLRGGSECLSE